MTTTMLHHAIEYARAGCYVLPLHTMDGNRCSCRHADCRSKAKHPRTLNGLSDATRDEVEIARWWDMWPDANIGISCGPSGLLVVDLDDRDGKYGTEEWAKIVADKPRLDTLTVLTGSGGLHMYFSGSLNCRANLAPGVDLKSSGGYVVAPPSLHESGRCYEWDGAEFAPQDIAPAPAWLIEAAQAFGKKLQPQTDLPIMCPDRVAEIRSALCCISPDDYGTWVLVGQALHAEHFAQGLALWHEWSQRSEKYDAKSLDYRWHKSFGLTNEVSVTISTLFKQAKLNGWTEPVREVPMLAALPVRKVIQPPEPLEPPQGVLRLFYHHCLDTAIRRRPANALAASICFGAVCTGRIYEGETGLRTNIQVLHVADASAGKDHGRKKIAEALTAAGLGAHIGGVPASDSAIFAHMSAQPLKMYRIDEFGLRMQQVAAEGEGGHWARMLRAVMEAFSSASEEIFAGTEYADRKNNATAVVNYPCLVLFATSSPATFYPALKSAHTASGFLPRFLVFEDVGIPRKQHRPPQHVPRDVVEWAISVRTPPQQERQGNLVGITPSTPFVVRRAEDARAMLVAFDDHCDDKVADLADPTRYLWGRGGEIADKLATIAACSVGSQVPVVSTNHAAWATGVVRQQIEWLAGILEAKVANSEYQCRRQTMLALIQESGGMTRRAIDSHPILSQWSRRERDDLLMDLKLSELIQEVMVKPPGRGRPAKGFAVAGNYDEF